MLLSLGLREGMSLAQGHTAAKWPQGTSALPTASHQTCRLQALPAVLVTAPVGCAVRTY